MQWPSVRTALALFCLSSCGGDEAVVSPAAGHAHHARFGGALVELGEHFANLEVAYRPDAGEISLYLLDAHAESVVKGAQREIPVEVTIAGGKVALAALPRVSVLAQNEVGSSSEFFVADERLRNLASFDLVVRRVEVLGTTFTDVSFHHPPGHE